jgi:hypothetical protein
MVCAVHAVHVAMVQAPHCYDMYYADVRCRHGTAWRINIRNEDAGLQHVFGA